MEGSERSEVDWEAVASALSGGIADHVDGRFVYVSDELAELVGTDAETLTGKRWHQPFDDETASRIETDAIRRARIDGHWEGVVRIDDDTAVRLSLSTTDGGALVWDVSTVEDEPSTETERLERERHLRAQRDELATLDRINELLLETTRELIQTASRDAVEQRVCERLAASELYQFA